MLICTFNMHLAKYAYLHIQQLFNFSMEIQFEPATEPAIKTSIKFNILASADLLDPLHEGGRQDQPSPWLSAVTLSLLEARRSLPPPQLHLFSTVSVVAAAPARRRPRHRRPFFRKIDGECPSMFPWSFFCSSSPSQFAVGPHPPLPLSSSSVDFRICCHVFGPSQVLLKMQALWMNPTSNSTSAVSPNYR